MWDVKLIVACQVGFSGFVAEFFALTASFSRDPLACSVTSNGCALTRQAKLHMQKLNLAYSHKPTTKK
jgi:hypothetical protein